MTEITREEFLDSKYAEWFALQEFYDIDVSALKKKVGTFLSEAQNQSVQEYMLQRKYNQLHDVYQPKKTLGLFGDEEISFGRDMKAEMSVKENIWTYGDYLDLEPELVLTNQQPKYNRIYNALRLFTSTGENNNNIGRNLYYIVRDKKTQKYLGQLCLSSDYLDVKCRDAYLGWTREQRNAGRINHTSVGSIIVPTQPFGYNYVGGKLLSLLLVTDQVQDDWQRLYNDKLVALTTTSFYGTFSQYTGLKYWKSLGKSMGSSIARPTPGLYAEIRDYVRNLEPRMYWEWFHGFDQFGTKIKRDHINRCLAYAYRKLGYKTPDFVTGHQRGIHFCQLYTNTAEYLKEEIKESELQKRFDNSVDAMVDLWKTKYAGKRINSLRKQGRILNEVLYYDDILSMTWEETKEKYMPQVGR